MQFSVFWFQVWVSKVWNPRNWVLNYVIIKTITSLEWKMKCIQNPLIKAIWLAIQIFSWAHSVIHWLESIFWYRIKMVSSIYTTYFQIDYSIPLHSNICPTISNFCILNILSLFHVLWFYGFCVFGLFVKILMCKINKRSGFWKEKFFLWTSSFWFLVIRESSRIHHPNIHQKFQSGFFRAIFAQSQSYMEFKI